MNHNVEFKGFDGSSTIRRAIDRDIAHLERRAKAFLSDASFLRLAVERTAGNREYRFSLVAEFVRKTLAARTETRDLNRGLKQVFRELEKQLEEYKSSMRREHLWKRLERREELHELKHGQPAENRDQEAFFALVNPHLNAVFEFVNHEVEYAEATGDLAPGELKTEEAVDAALVRAYRQFVKDPARGDVKSWLIRLATETLASSIAQSKKLRGEVSLEDELPRTPPEEWVSRLGEEIFDFFQPDDKMKVEDTVSDPETPSPEEEAETEETRQCVRSAVMTMPGKLRRVLFLHHVQGLSVAEVANATNEKIEKVQAEIDTGSEYLRQKLIEAGCAVAR